ncbi:MAG TPA: AI-2E family transporter [Alphaproteobacteria bacterium]|nr:AI-2E family transporter [Alphaproteobacteria bacterium]
MSPRSQLAFWIVAAIVLAILLYALRGVMLPFVAGMTIAFLFDPAADRLEALGLSRLMATSLITASFFILLIAALLLLAPVITLELQAFAAALPDYITRLQQLLDTPALQNLRHMIATPASDGQPAQIPAMLGDLTKWAVGLLGSALSGGLMVFNILSLLFLTPFVAFYFLLDWDRMVDRIDAILPRKYAASIRQVMAEINDMLSGFVRGQLSVCFLLALFYGIGLSAAGLKFGLIAGLAAGALSFVPFLGALTGLVLSLGLALVQYWPQLTPIAIIVAIFVAGQTLEGNFLTPRLVGKRVRLHPLWIMFALLAFGSLLGFTGMLLAVPLAAASGVLVRHGLQTYMQSQLFLEQPAPATLRKEAGDGTATGS